MKPFTNVNPRDVQHAVTLIRQARSEGRTTAIVGGARPVARKGAISWTC
jgi:hypothetical protein